MPNQNDNQKYLQSLLSQLSPEDTTKLNNILNDKSATEKIMATPQAQQLLKQLTGGK